MFSMDPGPCPICGTAHAACKGDSDAIAGVGLTRGVIVRTVTMPLRPGLGSVTARAAEATEPAAAAPPSPAGQPAANRAERRRQRAAANGS